MSSAFVIHVLCKWVPDSPFKSASAPEARRRAEIKKEVQTPKPVQLRVVRLANSWQSLALAVGAPDSESGCLLMCLSDSDTRMLSRHGVCALLCGGPGLGSVYW